MYLPLPPLLPCPWASLAPWDLHGASGSLGSLPKPSAAFGPQSDSGPCSPCSPSPPHPWASLAPWDLSMASGSLGSLLKPLAVLGPQSDSGALFLLLPLTSLALPHPLSLPGPLVSPWASGSLGSLLKPLAALEPHSGLLGSPPHAWGSRRSRGQGEQGGVRVCYTRFQGPHHLCGGKSMLY